MSDSKSPDEGETRHVFSLPDYACFASCRALWAAAEVLAAGSTWLKKWTPTPSGHLCFVSATEKVELGILLVEPPAASANEFCPTLLPEGKTREHMKVFTNDAVAMHLLFCAGAAILSPTDTTFSMTPEFVLKSLGLTSGTKVGKQQRLQKALLTLSALAVHVKKAMIRGLKEKDLRAVEVGLDWLWKISVSHPEGETWKEIPVTLVPEEVWTGRDDLIINVTPGSWSKVFLHKGPDSVRQTGVIPTSLLPALVSVQKFHDLTALVLVHIAFKVCLKKAPTSVLGSSIINLVMGYTSDQEMQRGLRSTEERIVIGDRFDRFLCVASEIFKVQVRSDKFLSSSRVFYKDGCFHLDSSKKRPKGFMERYLGMKVIIHRPLDTGDFDVDHDQPNSEYVSTPKRSFDHAQFLKGIMASGDISQAQLGQLIERSQSSVSKILAGKAKLDKGEIKILRKTFPKGGAKIIPD